MITAFLKGIHTEWENAGIKKWINPIPFNLLAPLDSKYFPKTITSEQHQ